ncbi:4-coumarate-CoA ligase-like 6-like, partial [Trifolium medium]|nr:4-coumarate-CoA ligase-like 6-like [Trifolium medium]
MASGLHKMGVSQGDVVLLLLPNSIYYPVVLLGVMYLGGVVTPLYPLSSVGEIRKQVNECGARFAFTIPENVKKLEPLGMPIIVVPENEKGLKHECFSCFFNLIYGNFDLAQKPVIKQEDTAIILYSSGTTGASKGVVLTHRNLIAVRYGLTESSGVGASGFNTEKFHNHSSLGLLAPNMEAKVVDWNSGAFLPPGSSGEIWLRGPSIMK